MERTANHQDDSNSGAYTNSEETLRQKVRDILTFFTSYEVECCLTPTLLNIECIAGQQWFIAIRYALTETSRNLAFAPTGG